MLFQNAHFGIACQHLRSVRGGLDIGGQVDTGPVATHVAAALPEFASRYVVDLAPVGNVDGIAVFTVALREGFRSELFSRCGFGGCLFF